MNNAPSLLPLKISKHLKTHGLEHGTPAELKISPNLWQHPTPRGLLPRPVPSPRSSAHRETFGWRKVLHSAARSLWREQSWTPVHQHLQMGRVMPQPTTLRDLQTGHPLKVQVILVRVFLNGHGQDPLLLNTTAGRDDGRAFVGSGSSWHVQEPNRWHMVSAAQLHLLADDGFAQFLGDFYVHFRSHGKAKSNSKLVDLNLNLNSNRSPPTLTCDHVLFTKEHLNVNATNL